MTQELAHAAKLELWRRGEIAPLLLHQGQLELLAEIEKLPSGVKEICLRISRRWGKSTLALTYAFMVCLRKPRAQVLVAAPSMKQASNITAPLVRDLVEQAPQVPNGAVPIVRQLKSSLRWEFFNGSQLILGGLDTASESFRGIRADLVVVEEGGATQGENFIYATRSVLMPVLLSTGGRMLHAYTPPPVPDHPIITVTELRASLNNALFERSIHTCPLYSKQQVEEMCEAVGGVNSLNWQREFLVQVIRDTEKTCVPEFIESKHVQSCIPLPKYASAWIAGDVGGVRDLTVFLGLVYDPSMNCVKVVSEHVIAANPTHAAMAAGIADIRRQLAPLKDDLLVVDAAGPTRSELAITYGEAVVFPQKPKNSLHAGLVMVREMLVNGELVIDPSCKLLVTTLRSAMFNAQRSDYMWNETIGHADALAALIYGLRHKQTNVVIPTKARSEEDRMQELFAKQDQAALSEEEDPWALS